MHMIEHMIKCDCCGNTAVAVGKTEPCESGNGTVTRFYAPDTWHEGFNRNNVHICPACYAKLHPNEESTDMKSVDEELAINAVTTISDYCGSINACVDCPLSSTVYSSVCAIKCLPTCLDVGCKGTRYENASERCIHSDSATLKDLGVAIQSIQHYCQVTDCWKCKFSKAEPDSPPHCMFESILPVNWESVREDYGNWDKRDDYEGDEDFDD